MTNSSRITYCITLECHPAKPSLFIAVWDGLRIHGARRGNVFCHVVLCSQALLLSSFSSPCSLSAFALMCSFYFMPKLMSQNENECYIIMCFTRCFANMICNAFLQVFHNMFYCSSVLFNSLELFRICFTVLQSNVFFMSISNVFVFGFLGFLFIFTIFSSILFYRIFFRKVFGRWTARWNSGSSGRPRAVAPGPGRKIGKRTLFLKKKSKEKTSKKRKKGKKSKKSKRGNSKKIGEKKRKQETWNRKRSFSSNIFKTSKPFKTSKTISWDSWMVLSLQFPQKVHKKSQDLHINCIKMLGCSNDSNAWSLQGSYVWSPSQLWQP